MVHFLIGIQGSGKTTFSKELAKKLNCKIISTDGLRNAHPDWAESMIWPEVYRLIAEALKQDIDIIYDATNITPKVRNRFKEELLKHNVEIKMGAYYFNTPWEICQKRVIRRNSEPNERFLPPEVVKSYADNIIIPTLDEGFSFIKIIENGEVVKEIYETN